MTLKEQLDQAKAGFIARVPEDVQTEILRHVMGLQMSGIAYGLKEGDKAPDFTLANPLGGPVALYGELALGPVVLIFYRGGWCPFCNIQLRAYQRILPDIERLGGRLIAVSPQSPDNSLAQKEKEELTFHVLSDPNGKVAQCYRLLYELPEYLQITYKDKLKRDFAEFNQTEKWVLPVPATYVIDKEGIVRLAYVNPDFMERLEPQSIIDRLQKLNLRV